MIVTPIFQLPNEELYVDLFKSFPCREQQIRTLSTLISPTAAPCRNLVVHGTEATGKSVVTAGVLKALARPDETDGLPDPNRTLDYALLNCDEHVTARHLYERTASKVADAVHWEGPRRRRCETLAQLSVELQKMLAYVDRPEGYRFVLVLDAIDRQREAPSTLLPGLARLSEIAEFVQLIATTPPPTLANATAEETKELWTRFAGAVHDALIKTASRTLPAFREACAALWPRFTAPILAGTHGVREFSKLLIAARVHFQDETLLDPGLALTETRKTTSSAVAATAVVSPSAPPSTRHLSALLPTTARLFLLCAYLASHNATKHDLTLFSTSYHGRRRRGGGGIVGRPGPRSKHRKIARKLLGAHAFALERLLAIFAAVRSEWTNTPPPAGSSAAAAAALVDSDAGMAIATLASLRLLLRVGAASNDPMDRGGKWRVNVGWEVVRSLGRSMGIEMEDWLID